MTLIAFELSMPNNNAWNGRWSGEGKAYVRVERVKPDVAKAIADKQSFYYNFGDGWGASVSAKIVDGKEAAKIRKKSAGFAGYDWMIWEIIKFGKIYGRHSKIDAIENAWVQL